MFKVKGHLFLQDLHHLLVLPSNHSFLLFLKKREQRKEGDGRGGKGGRMKEGGKEMGQEEREMKEKK